MEFLRIENFKCFYSIDIQLNGITVFAGSNGNGKSTAIQALLFLRRTIEHCAQWVEGKYSYLKSNELNVELNGAYCLALGNSCYIIPVNSNNNDSLSIGIVYGDKRFLVEYEAQEDQLWLTPKNITNELGEIESAIFLQEFYYLNAERLGPRIAQSIKFFDYPNAGFQGEYVAQLIAEQNYRFEVDERRRHPNKISPRLEQQVNAWLDDLMPGVSIAASSDTNIHSAQIMVENYFTKGDPTVATNIGFGISYVLPIIVTGLIAKEGSFMVVENPEAHLHPSAQSKIGRFLAKVAASGVRVIIETHSDHVLNGLQISAATGEINPDLITVNFFTQQEKKNETTSTEFPEGESETEPSPVQGEELIKQPDVKKITVNKKGELSHWPKGFFDQSQIDFAHLFKIRKG